MSPKHSELRQAEEFYAAQWSKPRWTQAAPNRDEADRWRAMEPLVAGALRGIEAPRILDLGCGRGWLTALLAELGEVLGIDPLQASIAAARELFPHLTFRLATTSELLAEGTGRGRFHLVVSSEVIEHVPEREKSSFLAEAQELLAPGGHLLLTTPRGVFWEAWREQAPGTQPVEDWVTEDELDRLAEAAGLDLVRRTRAHFLRRPLNWQGRLLQRVLRRRFVRHLPLSGLRARLEYAGRLYQVALWRAGRRPDGEQV